MKKLAFIIVSLAVLVLSACGGLQPRKYNKTVGSSTSNDTVLWVNSDGTDCDLGDFLEGDKDCHKTKKTVYYKAPKQSVISKLKNKLGKTKAVATPKVATPKTTVKKPVKKTVTYKRTTPRKSSYSKPRTRSFSSHTRKRR
jgi:hypothetical protein